jgi:plastocyanin
MLKTHRRLMSVAALIAAFAVITGLTVVAGSRSTSAHEGEAHPAHIHSGTCATLGDVVFPLNNVGGEMMDDAGTPVAMKEAGPTSAIPVDVSITTVAADLNTIISGGHAINVHESAESIGTYIACGDIGGNVMGSDLAIGLGELNDSGYSGSAWLHDNGDGSTTVAVFLTEAGQEGSEAEGEATPAAGGDTAAAGEVAVEIKDFMFMPAELDIAVGTTVTWTNSDSAPHTATQDGGGFQSDRLNQSETYSFTFDTAGTFEYHCEFHPNMHGTIVVQ